jgi:AcrR family transcriptional regulator
VLEATKQVIAELGVGAVTFAAIGARAGYSRGIVTHHFGSRQNLMRTLAQSLQNLVPAPPTGTPGRDRLLAQVDLYLTTLALNPQDTQVFSMLWAEAIAGDPDLRPIFTERDAEFRAVIAQFVRPDYESLREAITQILDAGLT